MQQNIQMTRRAASWLLLASLAACGGGDGSSDTGRGGDGAGGSGGGGSSGGGNDSGGGGETVITGVYSLRPASVNQAQMLTDADAMGATGFALLSTLGAGNGESGDFYVSDTAHAAQKFQYQLLVGPATLPEFLAQLNQQGANGYMFKSFSAFSASGDMRNVFVRNTSRSEQFSYEATLSMALTVSELQAELNEKGSRGFRWIGPAMLGSDMVYLYARRSDGSTYEYVVEAVQDETLANLQMYWNAKGADGWLSRGSLTAGDVYERHSLQSGAVEYSVALQTAGLAPEEMKNQMNANAAQGFFFFSEIVDSAGAQGVISIRNGGTLVHPLAGVSFP